ncbi:thiopurine S-methyltransferase [Leptolyngbya cf. ectocarpi LEGE 11479]|uniref:Thiopurine S-methyltransferase n=1 Tax=Leptolyngbya cf. ectocarpi LEGE 11479 TaxID=1828722 RepID=A0A928ZUB5_LEPEC|nr:thiopurine S-methyltransferase [Leptolyngbya ectocarpi]MBE9067602.1 thiopurine S-methyltransferase [Leptolyngbya cf. ectocarpi LEGE 11479]
MDTSFWLQKWEKNDIRFHESAANPALVTHCKELALEKGSRVFVPLCGKTLDIAWLLSKGCRVAGAELVEIAIEQLFAELGIEPHVAEAGEVKHYSATNIDIFVGNIFDVSSRILGPVEAIYDRAALVALPQEVRHRYTAHVTEITDTAPQLLVSYEYDQTLMAGPPFSISNEEVNQHYGASYSLALIESANLPGGLKGRCVAKKNVWLLKND